MGGVAAAPGRHEAEARSGGGGGSAFPFTGSAQITGSIIITGSYNGGNVDTLNSINAAAVAPFVHGDGHNITGNGEDLVILGGEGNTMGGGAGYSAIVGAAASQMSNSDTSFMGGGYQNNIQGSRTFTIGGNQSIVNNGADFSGIIGGQSNQINSSVTASVVIGGKNIAASKNEMVYVPGLEVVTGGANVTGSIIGGGNIRAGQQAGAFSSDSIELGSATVPVQYGNFIIHGSNTRDLGNKYNGFQIQAVGGNTIQFANSAFTGLGNDVHFFSMGANSVGRSDSIKLWSSGSGADLNLSTDVVIQSGNKLTMSGSIELAGVTGSVGQVIGVDAGGKAKWETASGGGGGITSFQQSPRTSSYTQATAPGCDYVFQTASIAGGTFAVGDILEIRSMLEQTGGSGTTYLTFNMYQGNVAPGDGYPGGGNDIPLAQSQNSNDGKIYMQKTLYINSATETSVWNTGNINDTAYNSVSGGDPIQNVNIDWTQDQTFYYGACIDNAGHTLKQYGAIIRKLNG